MGFVRGNLRGLRGYRPGGMPMPIYKFSGLGCGSCKKRGMGDDSLDNGLNPDGSVNISWMAAGAGVPLQSSGASSSWGSPSSGVISVFNNPTFSPTSATQGIQTTAQSATSALPPGPQTYATSGGVLYPTPQPVGLSSISMTTLLGGLGLLAFAMIAMKRR